MKKNSFKQILAFFGVALLVTTLITGNITPAAAEETDAERQETVEDNTGISKEDSGEKETTDTQGEKEQPVIENGEETEPEKNSEGTTDVTSGETEGSEEIQEPEKTVLKQPALKTTSKAGGTIKLNWSKVKGAVEYVVLRSIKEDGEFEEIYTSDAGIRYYRDEGRTPGEVSYYQVIAFSEGRESYSISEVIPGLSLEKVEITEISNTTASCKLVLCWKPVEGASSYQIIRKEAATGEYEVIGTTEGTQTSYTDTKRIGGTVYTYKVCAQDAVGGRGSYSKAMSQMAIDKDKKMIALTYDDGPSTHTPIVLDALEKYEAHATFFVVGYSIGKYGESLRREVKLGCEIGNHTYNHDTLSSLSTTKVQSTLEKTNKALEKQTGIVTHIMRPPGGNYNSMVCDTAQMPLIFWSIDTLDWKTRDTNATIQCVKQEAYDGAIVLMHDLHEPTAKAADEIIGYLKKEGYQMLTVSELAAYRGGMTAGGVYRQFTK